MTKRTLHTAQRDPIPRGQPCPPTFLALAKLPVTATGSFHSSSAQRRLKSPQFTNPSRRLFTTLIARLTLTTSHWGLCNIQKNADKPALREESRNRPQQIQLTSSLQKGGVVPGCCNPVRRTSDSAVLRHFEKSGNHFLQTFLQSIL